MLQSLLRRTAVVSVACAFGLPLLAQDDDPKLLDRQPAVRGPGFVSKVARPPTTLEQGFTSSGVVLRAWLTTSDLGVPGADGNDCWGYTSPAGREYALMCTSTDTTFVEITDPGNPQVIGHIDGPNSLWRDIKVFGAYAYAVSEGGSGIQVIDMTNIDAGVVTLVNTINDVGSSATHNVAIDTDSGYLYRTGGSSHGLRIYDLNADPTTPVFVAEWSARYVHDTQVVTYTSGPLAGMQVAFNCAGLNGGGTDTGLTILDVTDKSNITLMDQVYYGATAAYSHQGWLSEDRQYFFLGDEGDEPPLASTTYVIDVSDPYNAAAVDTFTNGNPAITHNFYTKGDLLFEANYRSGMRIFDVSDPLNVAEVGYFDTYPGSNSANFNGLWSLFPYFDSGTVIGSDIERGLFVWQMTDESLAISLPNGAPPLLDPVGASVAVHIAEANPGDLLAGSEKLFYDAGSGFVESPLVSLGGGDYDAVFPPMPCATLVAWYVEAQTVSGFFFRDPVDAPGSTYASTYATGISVIATYDMETPAAWSVGFQGDNATTGIWERVDPVGTAAQPEDDHTPTGTRCWVTGQGAPGGAVGANDVDNGRTTLVSAPFSLAGTQDPAITYWRWYSNDQGGAPNADIFEVFITDDSVNWEVVEVVGPAGPGTSGGWLRHSFRVLSIPNIQLTSLMQMRFVASDEGSGSIVEAAVDDLRIDDIGCGNGIGFTFCNPTIPNSTGLWGTIAANGSVVVNDNDLTLTAARLPQNQFGYFIGSKTQAFVFQPPGSEGILCLGGAISRWNQQVQNTGAAGEMSIQVDLNAVPPPNANVMAGETWHWQGWHRDLHPTSTSNFTTGVRVLFQ